MVVDDQAPRAAILQQALSDAGCEVVACLASAQGLMKKVMEHQPDVIIIDIESPDRDMLEHMTVLNQHNPKPVIMFSDEDDPATIEKAVRAGVSAYVVDGLNPARVKSIMDVAVARFREFQALRGELEKTKNQLADRRLLDEAKALLMKQKNMSEEEAYHAMRKMAMDRGQRMVDVAKNIISVMNLLNG
ncbi:MULTISPECIES: ANTAR domain-containing response regulator [unclassified Oceanobacter]|jgi:response regulator NasT|uniref:ANTAR domain-containing response regulator n=1 Tax=unclassified Oceanobacter TaxID=2620260 RepID=UPI0026E2BFA1|nr:MULTISPECIES: ANTAR domain-containing protein [unclassified Oceanobacter]MDO6683501.1 ANTAR domain-containing protein [Oceanobacter sp. 5_MG-2023]MDP2505175.1 ANTAR domain-containing protein [Oceanobacter sp. 3_MG-2023]MDP2548466.1 ANTAR domain-containing protein [Oceanobacter sp. 4_MG-2023]MDP2610335.1 ANTAR domain-containing protein [Oceanobacter sp. 1_MG-2023]MDP2613712.1 ANTAR domain-containing protein [Oceanobacter sp. 2_MG-2023]